MLTIVAYPIFKPFQIAKIPGNEMYLTYSKLYIVAQYGRRNPYG